MLQLSVDQLAILGWPNMLTWSKNHIADVFEEHNNDHSYMETIGKLADVMSDKA